MKHVLSALALAALAACTTVDRWHGVPATRYAESGWNVEVQALPAGPDEWDLAANSRDFHFVSDPLQSKEPLKAAAMRRAAELCGDKRPAILTEAQQPPAIALFLHVRCEAQ